MSGSTTIGLGKDWDPEAALKRLADAEGITVEEFSAQLKERANVWVDVQEEEPPVEVPQPTVKPHIAWTVFCWIVGIIAIVAGIFWMPEIVRHTLICFLSIGYGLSIIDRGMNG